MSVKIPCNCCGKLFVAKTLRKWYCDECVEKRTQKQLIEGQRRYHRRVKVNGKSKNKI